ncbi:MAG: glycosyltransferase [Candidatus Limnocylindria bacterium]
MRALFWSALATIVYTYLIFPVVVFARALLRPRPYRSAPITPSITVIVAAHNEEASIGAKLTNLLALDYPRDCLEIVVASDGSDDETETVVRRFEPEGVRLVAMPRVGKAAALNAAVDVARGEILVFSDANSIFAPHALRALTRPLADPSVGGVAGDQVYRADGPSAYGEGERSYWSFDRLLKRAESRAGSAISATGAIYAIRRSAFSPVPSGVTDDFATSTAVVAQGYRLVFAHDAVAYEAVAPSSQHEFDRKVRVMTRGLRGILVRRSLLDPLRYGFYAVQLASHKLLRRLVAVPLVLLAVASPILWRRGIIYRAMTIGQVAFYVLGVAGLAAGRGRLGRSRLLALPAFFILVNAAALRAALNLVLGRQVDRWETNRSSRAAPPRSDAPEEQPLDLQTAMGRLRGRAGGAVDASIVVPVNARGDLENVLRLLADLGRYRGRHAFEIVLVVNNYPPGEPPNEIEELRSLGATVLAIPVLERRTGEAICLAARLPGVRAARGERIILFDADCRIPDPTALLDWYVARFDAGAGLAYSRVDYVDFLPKWSVRARIWAHHLARWVKRVILRIPTTRGSNYGVQRSLMLELYDRGVLADDLNVGPAMRAIRAQIAYSGSREMTVLTSGRMFRGGWVKLLRYLRYRLRYNVRTLPVRSDAAQHTLREVRDPPGRYDYVARDTERTAK